MKWIRNYSRFGLFIFLMTVGSISQASLCKAWSKATEIGRISASPIDEQSGMVASKAYSRFYHINDSGDAAKLYVTDLTGKLLFTTSYSDQFPMDVEDLGYGRCGPKNDKKCLYIGDIGDNFGLRPFLNFTIVEERSDWPARVPLVRTVQARFPDGRHDAEAFAIHPNGDLFLITKSYSGKQALPATVFKLEASKMAASGIQIFTQVGQLDIPEIFNSKRGTYVVTSMSISPDGSKFLALTYNDAVEFNVDLSKNKISAILKSGIDFKIVKLERLTQMEAITYSPDGKSFYYSSEAKKVALSTPQTVPLMQVRCEAKQ